MPNTYFQFKQFRVNQEKAGMKVTTDGCLMGAWVSSQLTEEPKRILDIGTGTGLLALMLAQSTRHSIIDAIEINKEACEQAIENFSAAQWHSRLSVIPSSLQNLTAHYPYDCIVCNPPFFQQNLKGANQQKNQALHNDTLPFHELASGIKKHLSEHGAAFVMYPEWEMNQFLEKATHASLHPHLQLIIRNQDEGRVFRIITQLGRAKRPLITHHLSIRHGTHYSRSFSTLLSPFYLDK